MQSITNKSENSTRFPDDDMLKFPSSKRGGGYFCKSLGSGRLNVHPNVPRWMVDPGPASQMGGTKLPVSPPPMCYSWGYSRQLWRAFLPGIKLP